MMNGSIILCEKVVENPDTKLISLVNLRNRVYRGQAEKFGLYAEFSPERLGKFDARVKLISRLEPEKFTWLTSWDEFTIMELHMKRHLYRMLDSCVPIYINVIGHYALDLYIDDYIVATTSIEVIP